MSRWFHVTPDRCLLGLLTVEGVLLLSERLGWFAKGWAVLTAIAAVGAWVVFMLLWYVAAVFLRWRFQFSIRSMFVVHPTEAYLRRRKVVEPASTGSSSLVPTSSLGVFRDSRRTVV
jgi:hypothetical protein